MFFLVRFSREYYIKNICNTLHHKIIYDERDIWINKMLILAITGSPSGLSRVNGVRRSSAKT